LVVTVDEFLRVVLRSGLLSREQLQEALRGLPREHRDDPQHIADHLIHKGALSRFQATKLLKGTARGLLLGPFQVLAPIGKGGMGSVYLARDQRSEQLLALKILPPKRAREEERLLARFRREMEMSQRVSHPHIAWTCEVGVCQGIYYIAMEYIPGVSLYRLVNEEGPLRVPRAARLFSEIASALEHAHGQGLIHRDLKPSNIMITPHDHAKLLDLGLAVMQGETGVDREVIGGQGYIVGSMDYIAPEQSTDAAGVDPRSDIYGLGCTLYFSLTGRLPFPGGTNREKILRHRTEEPTPIRELNPDVSAGFAAVLRKMMAKKPEQRFATAEALREELLSWCPGEKALPLDRPNDTAFQQAVAVLEAAEPDSSELRTEAVPEGSTATTAPEPAAEDVEEMLEAVPVGIPEPSAPRRSRPKAAPFALRDAIPKTAPQKKPANIPLTLIGGLVLVAVCLAALAVTLLLRG
jgi:serine/threonine protein kinase